MKVKDFLLMLLLLMAMQYVLHLLIPGLSFIRPVGF